MVVWNEENVTHLLSRAGFGATDKDLKKYLAYGQERSVDYLCDARGTPSRGPGKSGNDAQDAEDRADLKRWWAKRMVKATSKRLVEKMTLFWHDHFASSYSVVKNNLWMAQQNATFRLWGMGSFHRLVLEVTRDPAMLEFLDGKTSTANKPNENYGRELMELFTLGVSDLNAAENYTQTDVEEITRALTGFQIVSEKGQFNPARFDGGSKTLFQGTGHQFGPGNLGVVDTAQLPLPPSTNVIDGLFQHRDTDGQLTMPRFLGKKMWEYFAYPAPSKARIDEITAEFIASGFVVKELLRSLFMHDDFYSAEAKSQSVKNPAEFAIHAIRALKAKTNAKTLADYLETMGMELFEPPSVNGWSQGASWLSSGQFLARIEFAQALAAGRDSYLKLTPKKLIEVDSPDAGAVVDQLTGLLGITARVPAGARQAVVEYFEGATNFADPVVLEKKVRGAIVLLLSMPEFQVH